MNRLLKHLLVSATLLIGGIGTALAEDFTFTVPVNLKLLQAEFTEGKVMCVIRGLRGELMGSGELPFAIPADGNFSQNVVVKFNAMPGNNPANVRRGSCGFFLKVNNDWFTLRPANLKPGAPFLQSLDFELSQ